MEYKKLTFYKLKFRKIIIFFSFIFPYLFSNSFAEDIDIETYLIKRKEILHLDIKNKILNNKNVDFKKLKSLKIVYDNLVINCFFGYQDNIRVILCY